MATITPKRPSPTIAVRTSTPSIDSLIKPTPAAIPVTTTTTADSPDSPFELRTATTLTFPAYHFPQPQPADVGFGYLAGQDVACLSAPYHHRLSSGVEMPATPLSAPLRSTLKMSGAARSSIGGPLSPTFVEEQVLEKQETHTAAEQAKDLKVKTRVRVAKILLRSTNFACSLIVLSMLSSTFSIFNATRALPPRNTLPPWAVGTKTWPQTMLLVIACVSLAMSLAVFYAYWRGGHRRAERTALYYTTFSIAFFGFSIVMWGIGAGVLHGSKQHGAGKDIWGWSCKDGTRKTLFQEDVSYSLVCRLQNWSLVCCLIEVVVELITVAIYATMLYRLHSKRRLHRSMHDRDAARSTLYLAQLRTGSAPNTPTFAVHTPGYAGPAPYGPPRYDAAAAQPDTHMDVKEPGRATQHALGAANAKPFPLQAAPGPRTTPRAAQTAFAVGGPVTVEALTPSVQHPLAPGEQTYASVAIPDAYASPLASPHGMGT